MTDSHKKGNLAPGKVNKNWRVYGDLVDKLEEEAKLRALGSSAAMINFILNQRYFGPEAIDLEALKGGNLDKG